MILVVSSSLAREMHSMHNHIIAHEVDTRGFWGEANVKSINRWTLEIMTVVKLFVHCQYAYRMVTYLF